MVKTNTRSEGAIGTHSAGAKSDGNTRSEGDIGTHSAGAKTDSEQALSKSTKSESMKTFC